MNGELFYKVQEADIIYIGDDIVKNRFGPVNMNKPHIDYDLKSKYIAKYYIDCRTNQSTIILKPKN